MLESRKLTASGLEGVVVAETRLSDVDGERGHLVIADRDVEALAGEVSFEALAHALWTGSFPSAAEEAALSSAFGEARLAAHARLPALGDALARPDGMDALRAATGHLELPRQAAAEAVQVAGALPVFAAAWARSRSGRPPVPPDPRLGVAADYLRMVLGEVPAAPSVAALDAYLVTVADHGMNASTFAARVVASTGSDLVSALVAAIGALKGPLHGGAPGPVLDMLDAIESSGGQSEAWLEAELAAGRRIMGMGHRIYRVRDPRAAVLERAVEGLERAGHSSRRLALARSVERAAEGVLRARHPDRPLLANVEFYTAVLLDAVGLPRALFAPTFAVSRALGWCAHVAEQRAVGRLIRPASRYVAPMRADGFGSPSEGPASQPEDGCRQACLPGTLGPQG